MDWAWASSLDQIWRSPTVPIWLTLGVAGFFGIIVLITLLRAEKSVANVALTVISLLAIGTAMAATSRVFGPGARSVSGETRPVTTALPQLACIDDLAGDAVLNACEKTLFGSAESAAAAVSYAASQLTRLTGFGDVAAANKRSNFDLQTLRRAVERDRYGLMAYVLVARDHCTPASCAAFRALADKQRVVANMDEHVYENLIARYAASWNAPAQAGAGVVAALPSSMPIGKPTNAEFPSAASTPPVNIMTPEPATGPAPSVARPPSTVTAVPAPRPAVAASPALAAVKKPPAPKRAPAPVAAPVQLAPAPPPSSTAAAPADD